jgi:hypothetical protein
MIPSAIAHPRKPQIGVDCPVFGGTLGDLADLAQPPDQVEVVCKIFRHPAPFAPAVSQQLATLPWQWVHGTQMT